MADYMAAHPYHHTHSEERRGGGTRYKVKAMMVMLDIFTLPSGWGSTSASFVARQKRKTSWPRKPSSSGLQ